MYEKYYLLLFNFDRPNNIITFRQVVNSLRFWYLGKVVNSLRFNKWFYYIHDKCSKITIKLKKARILDFLIDLINPIFQPSKHSKDEKRGLIKIKKKLQFLRIATWPIKTKNNYRKFVKIITVLWAKKEHMNWILESLITKGVHANSTIT